MSEFFFSQAAELFREYPFVRYGVLDVERDPREQGYGARSFDVVVAANVLHATRNLDETLDHVASLLAPGGVLVLYETTHHPSWFDISIGLIEGWQRFEDDLRADNPLLTLKQWESLLGRHGFEDFRAFPEAGSPAEVLPQHVILGRVPMSRVGPAAETLVAEQHGGSPVGAAGVTPKGEDIRRRLEEAAETERPEILAEFVRGHVMRILRRDASHPVGRQQRLMDLGVDSLMAVELRNHLSSALGLTRTLPATLIFDHPSVEAIATYLAHDVLSIATPPPISVPESELDGAAATPAAVRLQGMSDEQVEALVLKKLEEL
jgi:SAM-dependent methyltransferase